jgi:transposase
MDTGSIIVFEDEASFRQDSTTHATWSRRGHQPLMPVTGARKSVKVFGCVELVSAKFNYQTTDEAFNADTYIDFLEMLAAKYHRKHLSYIQDNASYHKDANVWMWFKDNRDWIEVYNLPQYSPELNAAEPIWKYTRKVGTHNKYFESQDEVLSTLEEVFADVKKHPSRISGYLKPFL